MSSTCKRLVLVGAAFWALGGRDSLARAQPAAKVALAAVVPASPEGERRRLRAALDRLLGGKELRGARVGIVVADADSEKVLYERAADELLNPASVTKVLTAALALERLGPEFVFRTPVYGERKPQGDVLRGPLYVRGSGDPKMVTEQVYKLASNVAALGIRKVTGDLVVDDTYFDGERLGPGWDQDESDRPYQAPIGAASANFNAIEVRVYPGARPGGRARVLTDPATSFVEIRNRVRTVRRGGRTRIRVRSVSAEGHRNLLRVKGTIAVDHPGWATWRKLDHPPYYFGTLFKEMLARVGVTVGGKVRTGRVPSRARLLTVGRSPSLGVLIRDMNKFSQNFMAEQILKTVGAQTSGGPGSWPAGVRAMERFLEEIGIPRGSFVFKNGSGLNDVNRFTARQIVRVLLHMRRRFQSFPELLASFAVAGADGSVRHRFRSRATYRRLRVKTGWLRGVSAIAGYVGTRSGRRLAFVLLINGLRRTAVGHRLQRRLARLLVTYPEGLP